MEKNIKVEEKKELKIDDIDKVSGGVGPTRNLDRYQDGIRKPEDYGRRR